MKKSLYIFCLTVFSVVAQETATDYSGIYIRPTYSVGSSLEAQLSGDVSGQGDLPTELDLKGFAVGYEIMTSNPKWSVFTELQWGTDEIDFGSFTAAGATVTNMKLDVDMFTIHVKPAYSVSEKLQILAGPYVGLGNTALTADSVSDGSTTYTNPRLDTNYTVWGLTGSIRYQFTPNISAEVGYNYFDTSKEKLSGTGTDLSFEGGFWTFGLMYQF
jgi:opacity protein-like surface antigen